jgi:hypothetical protein
MRRHRLFASLLAVPFAAAASAMLIAQQKPDPHANEVPPPSQPPRVVTPGPQPGAPPSDAIVLFDGKDLSAWVSERDASPAQWTVGDGAMTVKPGAGGIRTKQAFGDVQLHIEWASPAEVKGEGQGRGNSGVFLMANTAAGGQGYEIQVLDSYQNATYWHGMAGSVYKQHAPLVNASRKPGEWQVYDIVFRGPSLRRRRKGRQAGQLHRLPQWRADPGQRRCDGHHYAPGPPLLQGAPRQTADLAPGPR